MDGARQVRITLLVLAVLTMACGIGLRLHHLQVRCHAQLRAKAEVQSLRQFEVNPTRGLIVDRNGEVLALSVATQDLYAHPGRVEDATDSARRLAPILQRSPRELERQLRSERPFVYLERLLAPRQVRAVRESGIDLASGAFGLLPSSRRDYPRGALAVHLIGFANIDGVGLEGVEQVMDKALRGDPTLYRVVRDARRVALSRVVLDAKREPADVVLSIDMTLQHVVERELDRAMRATGARGASAVLLEVPSGEILALANRPAADPNRFGEFPPEARVNRAIVHQYEPGSTFKFVTMAAALERGTVRPGQLFDCEHGCYRVAGRPIGDTTPHALLSAAQILQKSSNIGIVKIAQTLEPTELRRTIVDFGFGRDTGVKLPGEHAGLLRPVEGWSAHSVASLAFGQEIAVTVLQMATAFATLANGGVRVPPRVILGTRDADGRLQRFERPRGQRIITSRTAATLTDMLEGVLTRGTGRAAQLDGYRLAGKSGTAQKIVDGVYSETDYVASFGGYGPLPYPRLACLVVVDSPRGDVHAGGKIAGPAFREIMAAALHHLRMPADRDGLTLAADRRTATERFASLELEPGPKLAPVVAGQVPDVRGMSLRSAISRLAAAGCRVRAEGQGRVADQRPAPGTAIDSGASCHVRLAERTTL